MAPLPTISDCFRVALSWTNSVNGLGATNVMHFVKSGGNPADLALKLNTRATATMWEVVAPTAVVTAINITPLDGGSVSFPYTPGTPANWTGHSGAGDFIPQVASVVKLLTAKRGRSYRGRIFVPFTSEAQVGGGGLNGTSRATMTAAWVAFHNNMTTDGWALVVASYKLATAEPVAALAVEQYTATQRRRNRRTSNT